jgi:hypothetical protein
MARSLSEKADPWLQRRTWPAELFEGVYSGVPHYERRRDFSAASNKATIDRPWRSEATAL